MGEILLVDQAVVVLACLALVRAVHQSECHAGEGFGFGLQIVSIVRWHIGLQAGVRVRETC